MKNSLLFLILISSVFALHAQKAKLHIKDADGERFEDHRIVGHSSSILLCEKGNFNFNQLSAVLMYEKPSEKLQATLEDAGVQVVDRWSDSIYVSEAPSAVATQPIVNIDHNLFKARSLEDTGLMLRILGVAGVVGGLVLAVSDYDDPLDLKAVERRQNTVKGLAIGGGLSCVIGMSLDLSGRRKLRKPK